LRFDKIEDNDSIRKRLKIKSELLTQQSLKNLQNLKPVSTKNLKIDEKPSMESKNNTSKSSEKSKPGTPSFR
jgi:hypothetical protein